MSVEFVKEGKGKKHIAEAYTQQKQISYFTQSEIQKNVTVEYLKEWATREFRGQDYFLNWVKSVFRQQNFISFFKYMRHPVASAKLINDEIKPQLKRVYYADDSYFKYVIKNKEVATPEELKNEDFETLLFNAILFNYNDIIIHDLNDINSPYREFICINDVVSIESDNSVIKKIAYKAEVIIEGQKVCGFLYMDDETFIFYDLKYVERLNIPHDIRRCPACWVANEPFSRDNDIVRKSMFSYVRTELEKLVFLDVLLNQTEPNGAFAITVKLKTSVQTLDGKDIKGITSQEPMASNSIGSQQAGLGNDIPNAEGSVMQAGTTVELPMKTKLDRSIDTDVVQNFMKQYYIPPENLDYMNNRIKEIERSIISNILGDFQQGNDTAKNDNQINRSTDNRQDKLRAIGLNLGWVRNQSDYIMLALKYGPDAVSANLFYGSDFFLDSESDLYSLFTKAPNPIERRNLLLRIGKTKYRFNPSRSERETILYTLLPFASDTDFNNAVSNQLVDDNTKLLQLRFTYWISLFEAQFGDITIFYNNLAASNSEKLVMINNLLNDMIAEMAILPTKQITPIA